MKGFTVWNVSLGVVAVVIGTATRASAQSPEGLMKQDPASKGSTDVAKEGFEKTAERPKEVTDATELKISAGGLLATGNSRTMAFTGAGNFRLRRAENQLTVDAAGNYARGAAPGENTKTTVENVQGRARYDRFLSKQWALFFAESARRDRFQGLNLRLNTDPGVAYYFLEEVKHRAWTELGYDLQYDIRRDDALAAAAAKGTPIDKTQIRHNVRAFAGYENSLSQAVQFHTGVEYLQAVVDTENWRLNWDVGLTSQISSNFSLATTFSLRYDHNPLPGVRNTDTTTAMSLVYSLL